MMTRTTTATSTGRRLLGLAGAGLVSLLTAGCLQGESQEAAGAADAAGADWTLAGVPVRLIEVPTAPPVGIGACTGVRPGAFVENDKGFCTFNFLFHGSDGRSYIGTAGHCILGDSITAENAGEKVWSRGRGPEARDGEGRRIGEFAYAVLQDPKDFALIRVDSGVPADPQMCHFGGPTGVNDELTDSPVVLQHYGNGTGIGEVLPARSAIATAMPDPDHVFANGVIVFGDSGSAIVSDDGRAVGVVVTIGFGVSGEVGSVPATGVVGITRLTPQRRRAEQALGMQLSLVTAPQL